MWSSLLDGKCEVYWARELRVFRRLWFSPLPLPAGRSCPPRNALPTHIRPCLPVTCPAEGTGDGQIQCPAGETYVVGGTCDAPGPCGATDCCVACPVGLEVAWDFLEIARIKAGWVANVQLVVTRILCGFPPHNSPPSLIRITIGSVKGFYSLLRLKGANTLRKYTGLLHVWLSRLAFIVTAAIRSIVTWVWRCLIFVFPRQRRYRNVFIVDVRVSICIPLRSK